MHKIDLPEVIQAVAKALQESHLDVSSQWVTGSITTQESRAPLSATVSDLVISTDDEPSLVVEFKRGLHSSLDLASVVRHLEVIRSSNPRTDFALVSLEPVSEQTQSRLQARGIRVVVGTDAKSIAAGLSTIAMEPGSK